VSRHGASSDLDFQRAVQAYLLALPAVNQAANRAGTLVMGLANTTVLIWEQLVDSRTVELTANDNTPYTWFWIDLRNGPLVSSQNKGVQANADGSVDIYFGPKAPPGKESNWVQTIPGKAWWTILRLYGPLEPWFKQSWRPDNIVLQP
jgi:hypothetical protein